MWKSEKRCVFLEALYRTDTYIDNFSVVPGYFPVEIGAHPCAGVCVGYDCTGFVSCQGFGFGDCGPNSAYGCNVPDCGIAYGRRNLTSTPGLTCNETNSACKWTCGAQTYDEICSNGIDDDDDGGDGIPNNQPTDLVDCEDPDCQHSYSWTDAEAVSYSCSGNGVTSTIDLAAAGLSHYCADNVLVDPAVGLCCPAGKYLNYAFGTWSCTDTLSCRVGGICSSDYGPNPLFSAWASDNDCLNPVAPSACCNVVKFGELNYWSDAGNVQIY